MQQHITIGSRGSALALTQSKIVARLLHESHDRLEVSIEVIKTAGDSTLGSLRTFGGIGVFTKEIENALLDGRVDLAVHSLKDLPTQLHEDLELVAVPEREDVRDVLICRAGEGDATASGLHDLRNSARVGTGSRRRQIQLRAVRRDLQFADIRGNLDTRIRQVADGDYDAIVLAAAGLHRLGWSDRISAYIDTDQILPAAGQGALGLQMRRRDPRRPLVAAISHPSSFAAVTAERAFLSALGAGCQAPIATWARVGGQQLHLDGLVGETDGSAILRSQVRGATNAAEELGSALAQQLRGQGADAILAAVDESP